MTVNEFRSIALSLPQSIESAHMDHPDFRVHGKVFATLGYPEDGWGMVNLPPDEQHRLVHAQPEVFLAAKGAWGRKGSTTIRLSAANAATVRSAIERAWSAVIPRAKS